MHDSLPKNIAEIKDSLELESLVRRLLEEGIDDDELDELDDLFAESSSDMRDFGMVFEPQLDEKVL